MKLEKRLFVKFFIFVVPVLLFTSGFQVIKGETISLSGMIERMDADLKFIVVNGTKIFISSNTKIMNEKGTIFKMDALKPNLTVVIAVLRNSDGFFANQIVIKTPKKKP